MLPVVRARAVGSCRVPLSLTLSSGRRFAERGRAAADTPDCLQDVPTELLVVTIAKALVELAGLFVLGQGLLYVLAGPRRSENLFYQLFQVLTRPLYRAVRLVTPRVILDRHIPYVALLLLLWAWLILIVVKAQLCAGYGLNCTPA